MSALGHKQTCATQKTMSALPPKADISKPSRSHHQLSVGPNKIQTMLPKI